MTFPRHDDIPERVRNAEETLRLLANVPPPEGLADRVEARLRTAPRTPVLTNWPGFGLKGAVYSPVLRGCAAAAIVVLVAGGGWRIYSRVQPSPSAKVIVMPARVGPNGGFSNAGAMRTPDTLNGPVLAHPTVPAKPNVIAPVPSPQPQTLAPQPKPVTHKKKSAPAQEK
jgi:hypothetical protein